jgi:hypothetical protein
VPALAAPGDPLPGGCASYGGPSLCGDLPALALTLPTRLSPRGRPGEDAGVPDCAGAAGEPIDPERFRRALQQALRGSPVLPYLTRGSFRFVGELRGNLLFALPAPPGPAALEALRRMRTLVLAAPHLPPTAGALLRPLLDAWARELDDWSTLEPLIGGARRHRIPVELAWYGHLPALHLSVGPERRLVLGPIHDADSAVAMYVGSSKVVTRSLLESLAVPMPEALVVAGPHEVRSAARALGYPVVLKHESSSNSEGVVPGIRSAAALDRAHRHLRVRFPVGKLIVERHLPGTYHRLLVIDGACVRGSLGRSRDVLADGRRPVSQLLGADGWTAGSTAETDAERHRLQCLLIGQELDLDTVPEAGRRVTVSPPTGGWQDCTGAIHPEVREAVECIGRALTPAILGIDIICENIGRPLPGQGGVIEVNSGPGTWFHADQPGLASMLLRRLFPSGAAGPPVILFAGPDAPEIARRAGQLDGGDGPEPDDGSRSVAPWITGVDIDGALRRGLPVGRCDVLVLTGETEPLLEVAVVRTVRRHGRIVAHPRVELSPASLRRVTEWGIGVRRASAPGARSLAVV